MRDETAQQRTIPMPECAWCEADLTAEEADLRYEGEQVCRKCIREDCEAEDREAEAIDEVSE